MEVHEGGCKCGDIRYRVRGKALRALTCHCRFCQRRTGSAFAIKTFFPQENVEFVGHPAARYQRDCLMFGGQAAAAKVGWVSFGWLEPLPEGGTEGAV